jgi:hypothetical protein
VTAFDQMSAAQVAIAVLEVALHATGLALLLWLLFSRRGRALPKMLIPEWRIPGADFVLFICFGFMGAVVASGVAGAVLHRMHPGPDASVVAASAATEAGFLLGMLGFHAFYGAADAGARPGLGAGLRGGLFAFLAAMPLVTAFNYGWSALLTAIGLPDRKQALVGILENTHSALFQAVFVLIASLLAPAAEEVLFRGGLFRYLRTRVPRWAAIASTSVVFGALHVQWSDHLGGLASLLPLVVLAATFCIAYERTGSIATPIAAHALFNLNMMIQVIAGFGS